MARWAIQYFPFSGENHSPQDYIAEIPHVEDAENLVGRLDDISELETYEWPGYVKLVDKLYQLTSGDYRLYFDIDGGVLIVVCYVCRKRSQKAKRKDLDQAHRNLAAYYQYKRSLQK